MAFLKLHPSRNMRSYVGAVCYNKTKVAGKVTVTAGAAQPSRTSPLGSGTRGWDASLSCH